MKLDDIILSYITKDGVIVPQRCNERVFKSRGWYDYVVGRYDDNTTNTFRESMYRLIHGIEETPTCCVCGKQMVFDVEERRFKTTCCCDDKEINLDDKSVSKRKKMHHNEKYGSVDEDTLSDLFDSLGVEYIQNTVDVVEGHELDFYLPSHNIAIEINGMRYCGVNLNKDKMYTLEKSIACANNGITLYHIWEDNWRTKNDVVVSMLKGILGIDNERVISTNLYECVYKFMTSSECNEFLNKYSLLGPTSSSTRIGLYNGDELLAVVTFSRSDNAEGLRAKRTEYILDRFCVKSGCTIPNIHTLMLRFAIRFLYKIKCRRIIFYCERDWPDTKPFEENKFVFEKYTEPEGFYSCDTFTRTLRLGSIANHETNEEYEMKEQERMAKYGLYKCYNTGKIKMRLDL